MSPSIIQHKSFMEILKRRESVPVKNVDITTQIIIITSYITLLKKRKRFYNSYMFVIRRIDM